MTGVILGAVGGLIVYLAFAVVVARGCGMNSRPEPVGPRRIPVYPPPVFPTRPVEADTDWLGIWPVRDEDETDLRFWQTVSAEDWNERRWTA